MLRRLLGQDEIIVAPGAHDATCGMIIEKAGFNAIYVGSHSISASVLGKPDIGLLTLTEMTRCVEYINDAVSLPVIADSEAGYGNAINVMRAVREFEKVGTAAIHIEDQIVPKPWNSSDVCVSSMDEHIKKIEAALEAREDEDFVIIARTDARTIYGIDEAIKRGKAYAEAGADVIFVHDLRTIDELKAVARKIDVPVLLNFADLVVSKVYPLPSIYDFEKIGFRIAICPSFSNLAERKAVWDLADELKKTGTIRKFLDRAGSFAEFAEFLGAPHVRDMERKFVLSNSGEF